MPHGFDSLAEYYRAHGEAFRLALQLGCTPKEAELELRRRRSVERSKAASERLKRKMCGTAAPDRAEDWDAPWMMRD